MIPYGRQEITKQDIEAVITVLQSDFLTQGPQVPQFEKAVADHSGCNHAIAVNSATSALHIACLALGLGPGDWLWTTPITFVASANCGLYCGANIDFVDIDPLTYNLCAKRLEEKLIQADKVGRLPKVLVAVHLCGQSCDMIAIHSLSQRFGFKIIEDASHAIGAKYKEAYVGSCKYSDITIFSFHPVKIVTTAEGGVATTNCPALADTMRLLRSHGITRDPSQMMKPPDGSWYYEQIQLGFNYRMTDLQAALGCSQMLRLNDYVSSRHRLAKRYNHLFSSLPVLCPWQHPDNFSAFHLYVIRLKVNSSMKNRGDVFEGLRVEGIGVNLHYIPLYRHPHYSRMGFNMQDFPESERYYHEAISLPMYPTLTNRQQDKVVEALKRLLLF